MKKDNYFEELIRKQDPRFIDWQWLSQDARLTENLIREYVDHLNRTDWGYIIINKGLSDNFEREFYSILKQFDLVKEND